MDHLGIERFSVMGMCIGGAFIMELLAEVPDRVSAAVAMQPIGLVDNRDDFRAILSRLEQRQTTIAEPGRTFAQLLARELDAAAPP